MSNDFVEYFMSLSLEKREMLLDHLVSLLRETSLAEDDKLHDIRHNHIINGGIGCPHCGSTQIISYGSFKGKKRYKCKDCEKTFSEFTTSAVYWLHKKDLLREYLFYFLQGYSLRRIADEMDICLKTAFLWRHKILYALNQKHKKGLKGLIEVDDTYFRFSEKGNKSIKNRKPRKRGKPTGQDGINKEHVAVFVAFCREDKSVSSGVGCRGRITMDAFHEAIGKHLDRENCLLCTDSHHTYQGYSNNYGIKKEKIFIRKKQFVKDKIYHIQNVNNVHSQLKTWIKRFKGVASKYLNHYLEYFNLIYDLSRKIDKPNESLRRLLEIDNGFIKSTEIKHQYCIT